MFSSAKKVLKKFKSNLKSVEQEIRSPPDSDKCCGLPAKPQAKKDKHSNCCNGDFHIKKVDEK